MKNNQVVQEDANTAHQESRLTGLLSSLLFCLVITGCVSVPTASHDFEIPRDEMASHVKFLSQPKLKGRKPGTMGSRLARNYIEARFKAYGLIPWENTAGYEQSFGFGRNIVGVLPGTDTNLSHEIVILSAHYDHLGKENGKIYPGAADNASGVAALLETAKQMSRLPHRPKRSVAFIAFDCEENMLLGSFAFSCRQDVRQNKISAVVNIDMLGRDFMDVVTNAVFVTGTEEYPGLRNEVGRIGTTSGMRILPVGTDLVGPRSDHVAFESLGVPCLFFSCGTFRDYHKPTDTADKLNYAGLDRSAKVIFQTVRELADAQSVKKVALSTNGDLEELRTITTVLTEVLKRGNEAGLKKEDTNAFNGLENHVERLLSIGRYDYLTREELLESAAGTLAPYLCPFENSAKPPGAEQQQMDLLGMQWMQHVYINYRREMTDMARSLVEQVLKYQPGAFRGMPKFEREIYKIDDDSISLMETRPGKFELDAMANLITLNAEVKRSKWLVNSFAANLVIGLELMDCEGTREQVADYCLLWMDNSNGARNEIRRKLLTAVSGEACAGTYHELLSKRLVRGGFKDETEWRVSCILNGPPALAKLALETATPAPPICKAACQVIADHNRRTDVRAQAIEFVAKQKNKQGLLAVCDILDDASLVYKAGNDPLLRGNYPFTGRMLAIKSIKQFGTPSNLSKTLGDLALEELKEVAGKDFGKDIHRWRNWIGKQM